MGWGGLVIRGGLSWGRFVLGRFVWDKFVLGRVCLRFGCLGVFVSRVYIIGKEVSPMFMVCIDGFKSVYIFYLPILVYTNTSLKCLEFTLDYVLLPTKIIDIALSTFFRP